MCFFKIISLTKHKAWLRFIKLIVNIHIHKYNHKQIVATYQCVNKGSICFMQST
jgi:hypothetical protein